MISGDIFVGLMSGTSADGIDAALIDFSHHLPKIICSHASAWGPLQAEIHALCQPGANEIQRLAELDRKIGERFADVTLQLLEKAGLKAGQVTAIGSHGQTIRHQPPTADAPGFTLQIGDPNIIAERTGITTVADLRRRDMAVGGHGAPLVPAFHQALFEQPGQRQVVVNIGGIANITVLAGDGRIQGHDTGPGNVLMDAWCHKVSGAAYDADGQWAATGVVQGALLNHLLAAPYFKATPPKSTGRELFNLSWLENALEQFGQYTEPKDVQATLLELTAQTIAQDIQPHYPERIYVCGGGALNSPLMQRLSELLAPAAVASTKISGIDPEWIEATAFAWLAKQTINGLPGNAPQATGASKPVVLGGIYPA